MKSSPRHKDYQEERPEEGSAHPCLFSSGTLTADPAGEQRYEGRRLLSAAPSQARRLALAFVVLCVLVAFGATRTVDRWGLTLASPIASYPLDVAASLVTLLGEPQISGAVAVALSVRWWQRRGKQGLAPLLLFAGVAIEAVLKYVLPYPGPPHEFSRGLQLPLFFQLATPLLLHLHTPYSFPSGHMLRTTFLVALISEHRPRWRTAGWALVLAMAFTRVYLNDHWVSDVGGGILLGLTLAAVATVLDPGPPTR